MKIVLRDSKLVVKSHPIKEQKMSENEEYPQGATEEEYQGKPMLNLNPEDRFSFKFGLKKAEMILAHLEDIQLFVEKYKE